MFMGRDEGIIDTVLDITRTVIEAQIGSVGGDALTCILFAFHGTSDAQQI
jgi:hypothetical protein